MKVKITHFFWGGQFFYKIKTKIVFSTEVVNNINDIWPNLELYMHGGVNFQPYKNQFSKLIGNKKMNISFRIFQFIF